MRVEPPGRARAGRAFLALCLLVAVLVLAPRSSGSAATPAWDVAGEPVPFGTAAFFGSTAGQTIRNRIVAMSESAGGHGYWLAGADGGVFAFGDAPFMGSVPGLGVTARAPVVGIAATPDGQGYWLAAADGGVFAFGDAPYMGSVPGLGVTPRAPVVGVAGSPGGQGYWLAAADGGVFAFGDAPFLGSMGGTRLAAPVVGVAGSPGGGYRLVAADGGVFCFGAPFEGSAAGMRLVAPVVGIASTADSFGYWLAGADGGVFTMGDATFLGSVGGTTVTVPVGAIAATPDAGGYWLLPVQPLPSPPVGGDRVVSFGSSAGGAFYITIDDGYYPSDQVLALMRSRHLPITAFLISNVAAQHLDYWRSFLAAGGEIEDHTVSHPDLTLLSPSAVLAQWSGAAFAFRQWFGITTTLGRPPYGNYNTTVRTAASQAGLRTLVLWSASMYQSQLTTSDGRPLRAGEIVILHWIPGLYDSLVRLLAIADAQGLHAAPLATGIP